jgi:two-component system OmpR family response regulator
VNDRPLSDAVTVLVVDDEPNILDLLSAVLRLQGYEVHTAENGMAAISAAATHPPDIVILDVMLPDFDGFAVVRRLRDSDPEVPILFLTARDSVDDRITGLTVGADDYVCKPFSLEEVVLRVQAILRRTNPPEFTDRSQRLRYADLELDADAHTVHRGGRPVPLSATEFQLLHYLMVNSETVVSKQQILDRVWGHDSDRSTRVVETFISQLRRKVDDRQPPLIHTFRGVGYTLRLTRSSSAS